MCIKLSNSCKFYSFVSQCKMKPNYDELPEEIWKLILKQLGDDHHSEFESLSLVNKRMLSLTDRLRLRFTVVDQAYFFHGTIFPYTYRFKNLKALDLSKLEHCEIETDLAEIARSPAVLNLEEVDISNLNSIPIESLKALGSFNRKIKILKCTNLIEFWTDDLRAIAKFLPDLEELDISYSFSRQGLKSVARIECLSSGLKNLIKINISKILGVSDESLIYLSSNCLRLQEILFEECLVTIKGVLFMLHNSHNLRSISMTIRTRVTDSLFIDPVVSTRCLSNLRISCCYVSDNLLNLFVKAHFPLESVCFPNAGDYPLYCYTLHGLSSFLHAYHSLKFLDLSTNEFLNDSSIEELSQYLHDLVSIKLNSCFKLTIIALLALINNCLFLEHVEMEDTHLHPKGDLNMNIANYLNTKSRIKSLNLGRNPSLCDEYLLKICSVCPKLKQLDVSSCPLIASSIVEILLSCHEVEHLSVQDCGGVKSIGLKFESFRLKKLCMARSGVNDEGLVGIAVSCNELVKIDLQGCENVTTSAVKFMVRNCEKLREVNLMGCSNLDVFIVDWMVCTRPSLRKLVPPCYDDITEDQRQLMLTRGCQVCAK